MVPPQLPGRAPQLGEQTQAMGAPGHLGIVGVDEDGAGQAPGADQPGQPVEAAWVLRLQHQDDPPAEAVQDLGYRRRALRPPAPGQRGPRPQPHPLPLRRAQPAHLAAEERRAVQGGVVQHDERAVAQHLRVEVQHLGRTAPVGRHQPRHAVLGHLTGSAAMRDVRHAGQRVHGQRPGAPLQRGRRPREGQRDHGSGGGQTGQRDPCDHADHGRWVNRGKACNDTRSR